MVIIKGTLFEDFTSQSNMNIYVPKLASRTEYLLRIKDDIQFQLAAAFDHCLCKAASTCRSINKLQRHLQEKHRTTE